MPEWRAPLAELGRLMLGFARLEAALGSGASSGVAASVREEAAALLGERERVLAKFVRLERARIEGGAGRDAEPSVRVPSPDDLVALTLDVESAADRLLG